MTFCCDGRTSGEADSGHRTRAHCYISIVHIVIVCAETQRLQRGGTNQSTLSFATSTAKCTCGWDHVQNDTAATATAEAEQPTQLPPPKITIDFGVLRRPDPRKTIGDVRGMHKVYKSPGYYDLEVFGYVDGKCPHCKCTPKPNPNKLGVVKMVHTSGQNAARVKKDGNRPRRRTWIHYRYTSEGN